MNFGLICVLFCYYITLLSLGEFASRRRGGIKNNNGAISRGALSKKRIEAFHETRASSDIQTMLRCAQQVKNRKVVSCLQKCSQPKCMHRYIAEKEKSVCVWGSFPWSPPSHIASSNVISFPHLVSDKWQLSPAAHDNVSNDSE